MLNRMDEATTYMTLKIIISKAKGMEHGKMELDTNNSV